MSIKSSQFNLDPKEAYRLFKMSVALTDTLEDILEKHASYSKKFLHGLAISLKQAKTGKLKKIISLSELK